MNFTREPIIETVIMPREGCKLLVRNSKGSGQEEYYVESVEVVSFGHSLFFRSLEKPKSFLVPVSDYEVLELKETRLSLKNVSPERSIKIGGGREGPVRPSREGQLDSEVFEPQGDRSFDRSEPRPMERGERKRDKRRRGRRGGGRSEPLHMEPPLEEIRERPPMEEPLLMTEGMEVESMRTEEHKAPSFISKLFPPPTTLIKETLSRYKPAEPEQEEVSSSTEDRLDEMLFDGPFLPESKGESEEEPFED